MESIEITNDATQIMRTKTRNIEGVDYIKIVR